MTDLSLENWVTVGYFNLKDYEHALPYAQQMWLTAQQAAKQKKSFARDATLGEAAVTLSEINLKLKKRRRHCRNARTAADSDDHSFGKSIQSRRSKRLLKSPRTSILLKM